MFDYDINLNMWISRNRMNYCLGLIDNISILCERRNVIGKKMYGRLIIDIIRKSWTLRDLSIEIICDLLVKTYRTQKSNLRVNIFYDRTPKALTILLTSSVVKKYFIY